MSRAPIDPTATMAAATAGLLHSLGVAPVEERDELERTCRTVLDERGHPADVVGLHYGTLTLRCTPVAAGLLRWDLDGLQDVLDERFPGRVTRIVVHTR